MIGNLRCGYIDTFNRPSIDAINKLKNEDTSVITDAQQRTGAMDPAIKPLKKEDYVIGTAITIDLPAEDNLMLYKALQIAQSGDVLVVNTNNNFTRAIWGELLTRTSLALDLGGLVVNGFVRDGKACEETGFPIFCRGASPVSVEKNGPGFVNGDISCGGVIVSPGDVIVGDSDGVVVIKQENLPLVIETVKQLKEKENIRIQEITNGKPLPSWLATKLNDIGLK